MAKFNFGLGYLEALSYDLSNEIDASFEATRPLETYVANKCSPEELPPQSIDW